MVYDYRRKSRPAFLGFILTALMLGQIVPAEAQQVAPNETHGPSAGTAGARGTAPALPDAIVLVAPTGDEATVAVTYSTTVSHAAARDSLSRLARLAGWKLRTPVIKDQEMFGYNEAGERRSLGKQTGVEASASGVSNLIYGSSFRLQPFVEAFKSLNRVELFFMTGELARFTGLKSYSDRALSVALIQAQGGTYRYRVEIHDHAGSLPKLPLDEPPAITAAGPVSGGPPPPARPLPYGPILIIAACAGLAAFAALRLLAALHFRGRTGSLPDGGRPLHSGPYIVSRRKD